MKTIQITVNSNYRKSNDDQYARTTLIHTIDLEEGETKQDATLRAIKELDDIFRMAYPHVHEFLNFHVVKQVNGNDNSIKKTLHTFTVPPEPPNHSDKEIEWMNKHNESLVDVEKLKTGTIEEQIDASFNLIEEINKCKTLNMLKVYNPMLVDIKEVQAYDEKRKQLEAKKTPTV